MAVPLYVFTVATPNAAYHELSKNEEKLNAFWARVQKVTEEHGSEGENVIMCDSVDGNRAFLIVGKYPSLDAYAKERRLSANRTGIERYFDIETRFGHKREDWQKEFGNPEVWRGD